MHTGKPYSPCDGVPAVAAKDPPVCCHLDPEKFHMVFDRNNKLRKLVISPMPGGKGFSGPKGFYLLAGGDPAHVAHCGAGGGGKTGGAPGMAKPPSK